MSFRTLLRFQQFGFFEFTFSGRYVYFVRVAEGSDGKKGYPDLIVSAAHPTHLLEEKDLKPGLVLQWHETETGLHKGKK